MDEQKDTLGMLDLILRPGFTVENQRIVKVNQAAQGYFLSEGMDLMPLLLTGAEEYASFSGGCLFLTLSLGGRALGASVIRMGSSDVFLLEQEADTRELASLALAARELREPLAGVMAMTGDLLPLAAMQEDPRAQNQAARLNRSLLQLLRIIGNMSDANRYAGGSRQEVVAISRELDEIFEKLQTLVAHTGIRLTYTGLQESIYCLADKEQLERAVLNILSNAIKFTPKDGAIEASLTRSGRMLRLSVVDTGAGIEESVRANVFHRYLRQLTIEDSRCGIGLGMVLIRSAAANHGGTVLIDHPEDKGTRITMTMMIRQNPDTILRSSVPRVDYAGGHDHALLELSESLPLSLYTPEK